MVQTLQVSKMNMRVLINDFHLEEAESESFFREWQTDLPELSDMERSLLDRIKANFFNSLHYPPTMEKAVQVLILGPMLSEAGFFHIEVEKSVEVVEESEGALVRGQIDFLLLKKSVWVAVIESTETYFSLEVGIAQLLSHMLTVQDDHQPCYGLLATSGSFLFIKVVRGSPPIYAMSDQFNLRRRQNELYNVYAFLKKLGQI